MPTKQIFTAAIEAAINQALRWANNSDEVLAPLYGKTCIIHIQEWNLALSFNFAKDEVNIVTDEEGLFNTMPDELSDDECWVSLSLFALEKIKQNNQITTLIKSGQLDFAGDLSILQSLGSMFDKLELDMEEVLSKYIGDVAAYQVNQTGKKVFEQANQQLSLLLQSFSDAALDEKPLGVRKIMAINFSDEVNQLKHDVDALEARISCLEKQRKTRLPKP
ncbi:ubiquinone biosynthesis accessory factor UbiJ [Glaciecola petra]|uniref:Ubiquinone biosynthesis accessory factor UbiJ n=1 Tax=Glaciecola petra TaxID=3075602 RepID=A0ABU2ZRZ3_9ALTE|nr:SCP2 sterol-binding domain-containing protein [Aestuariibacter sp. P117]MDT0595396.1 SCP2 sterol-binding domain-containing protein [Aestuariibacter sp. P117]